MFIEAKGLINPSIMSNIVKIIDIFLDNINKNTIRFTEATSIVLDWLISIKYIKYASFDQSANEGLDLLITYLILPVKSREVAGKVGSVSGNYSKEYSRPRQTSMMVLFFKNRLILAIISFDKKLHHRCLKRS